MFGNYGVPIVKNGGFNAWVQKVMPGVYDDSMTYYQLLSKVISYLNQMNDQQNEIIDWVNKKQNEQDEKIEFLKNQMRDFQKQIREQIVQLVKDDLQEMVDDGTMAKLINEIVLKELNDKIGDASKLGDKPQSVIDSLSDRGLNVKDFGATGNGVTDDTIPFQNAIAFRKKGQKLIIPAGTYKVDPVTPFIIDNEMVVEGAGRNSTILVTSRDAIVFETKNASTGRTQNFKVGGLQILANFNKANPVMNLTGGSYFELHDMIITGNESIKEQMANAIVFPKGQYTFNGYITIDKVFIQGFKNGLWGEGNDIKITGGFYNGMTEYGIYLTPANVLAVTGIEASRNGVDGVKGGGVFAEGNGIHLNDNWYEYNARRNIESYNPNNVDIGPTSRNVFIPTSQRQDYSSAGIIHGTKEDYGMDFNSGISNSHFGSYGLIANGWFDSLDANGIPFGWRLVGNAQVDRPILSKEGYGKGIRITSGEGSPKFLQSLIPTKQGVIDRKGKRITCHMYVRLTTELTGEDIKQVRFGITPDILLTGGLNNGSILNGFQIKKETWTKITFRYTIKGDENQINCGFQIPAGSSLEIAGVSSTLGELNLANFEKPVTSAGGEVFGEFRLQGRKLGYSSTVPTSGSYNLGDILFNNNSARGKSFGWYCVTSGAPGIWEELPDIKTQP
jgi:hypothetical protein